MPTFRRILTVLLIWNVPPWLVLGWLLAPVVPGGWWTVAVVALVCLLPLVAVVRGIGSDAYPSARRRVWVNRPAWYSQLLFPLLGASGVAGVLAGLVIGAPRLAGRWTVGVAAVLLVLVAVRGYVGSRRLEVRELDVSFPYLPHGLDGMRVVQLSDLHVGPHTPRRFLARIAEAARAARPDLIALTGDQVDDFARDVEPLGRAFGELSAPLGVFAVAGNHDVYAGWESVRRGMEALGWVVLVNDAVSLERNGSRFWIAGTGDPAGGRRGGVVDGGGGVGGVAPDVGRTLSAVPPDAFTLVLAHNPALWPELAERGADLTLSGHTHHGQLAIPRRGWSLASAFLDLAMGVHRRGRSVLYISPGTNYWGIPFRIGALAEVTVVTLRRAPTGVVVD